MADSTPPVKNARSNRAHRSRDENPLAKDREVLQQRPRFHFNYLLFALLGGRVAEHVMYGEFSTGASDDLARATDIARSMVTQYAMVPELGNATYAENDTGLLGGPGGAFQPRRYSEETAREIDCAVRVIVDAAFDRARTVLEHNRPILEESARALLERETLSEADLLPIFEKVQLSDEAANA